MRHETKVIYSRATFIILLVSALMLMVMLILTPKANAAQCSEIPQVFWWSNTSAEKMTAYVDRKYDGDWDPYIKKWERYEENMRNIMFRGRSAVVKSHDIVLKDDGLVGYVKQISKRIEATRCIAEQVLDARLIEELVNIETAAGGNLELEILLIE